MSNRRSVIRHFRVRARHRHIEFSASVPTISSSAADSRCSSVQSRDQPGTKSAAERFGVPGGQARRVELAIDEQHRQAVAFDRCGNSDAPDTRSRCVQASRPPGRSAMSSTCLIARSRQACSVVAVAPITYRFPVQIVLVWLDAPLFVAWRVSFAGARTANLATFKAVRSLPLCRSHIRDDTCLRSSGHSGYWNKDESDPRPLWSHWNPCPISDPTRPCSNNPRYKIAWNDVGIPIAGTGRHVHTHWLTKPEIPPPAPPTRR